MMNNDEPGNRISAPDMVYWTSLGRTELVEKALNDGIDANAVDEDGYSALQAAAENNHIEIVKLLIGNGANVDYKGSYTALELANMSKNSEVADILKSHGAK